MAEKAEDVFRLAEEKRRAGDWSAAAEAYARAIELKPDYYEALNNYANLRMQEGDFDEAAAMWALALVCKSEDPTLLFNSALLRLRRSPVAAWPFLASEALVRPQLLAPYRYELEVRRAIGAWVTRKDDILLDAFAQARSYERAAQALGPAKNFAVMRAFRLLIQALRLLPGPVAKEKAVIVGDSHVLAYTRSMEQTELAFGCKAWHLAQEGENVFKRDMHGRLSFLPKGSVCYVSVGEIDCRLSEGILPYCWKTGTDFSVQATFCAQGLVRFMTETARPYGLRLRFLNVPAPHMRALMKERTDWTAKDFVALVRTIRSFNEALAVAALAAGCGIVDLYDLTTGPSGCANEIWHLDQFHLKPQALETARLALPTREAAREGSSTPV